MSEGLRVPRRFTEAGTDPYDGIEWSRKDSRITNPDGSVVFEMTDAEVPADWSQVAVDIIVSKYFRKAGVPITDEDGTTRLGPESSARQVFDRLAGTWRRWGEDHGYFASADDADAFEDEIKLMLASQIASPNSPQWFNTGLNHAYGLTGPAQGFWYVDPATEEAVPSPDSYTRPAPHACFIESVTDDLVNDGGIMDLWLREARLFKFGSGTGTNFSTLRGSNESLSGGGKSSGVMSFLKIGDRAAGAIKSGGTTRRAAKMVILDLDHPDIEEFVDWKKVEEEKAKILIRYGGYPADFNGEAYATVSGQNSNNSVRVPNEFIHALEEDGDWKLTERTTGKVRKTIKARDLWKRIAEAAWACADPGVQFDTIINEWHTCPTGGRIRATNPCSEYVFLDDTACNLASINLVKFLREDGSFDVESFEHVVRLWTIVLEISVTMAHFPSKAIAYGSYWYRTLGLGYANLGSLLMRTGKAYDSDEGRAVAAALTAILTGYSYATSAEMAASIGPFPKFAENRESMLRVMRNHRRAAYGVPPQEYEGITHRVLGIDDAVCPPDLLEAARSSWDLALSLGERHGYRNAQVSCIAPTGCLVGGTLVPTERGLMRLGSLGNPNGSTWQDLGLAVGTDEGAQRASQFYVNGVEPVVAVETERGYGLKGTPTHRIKVVGHDGGWEWKRLAEIQPGDLVPLQMNQLIGGPQEVRLPPLGEIYWTGDFTTSVPRLMNADLAEFLGYFMGDGSMHAKGLRLCVAAEDFDVVERLRQLGKALFSLEAHVSTKTGYIEVAFHSVPLVLWWEACGFAKRAPHEGHSGKGYTPHVPDALLASNDPEAYRAFLRGLLEADGTVTAGMPNWSTTSASFADEVQAMFLALGYPATRRLEVTGWGESRLDVLRLLNSSYNESFLAEIGFMGGRKRGRVRVADHRQAWRFDHIPVTRAMLDRLQPANDELRKTLLMGLARNGLVSRRAASELYRRTGDPELSHLLGFFYDRVASAELGDEELTYDLSVPANLTYVAGGFVSHNTIGLQMDCDTTGVEPDFALVKFKKLAGGGYFKIVNQSVAPALTTLGYSPEQVREIVTYVVGTSSLDGAPHVNLETLTGLGFDSVDLDKVEAILPSVFELRHAFNVFVLGEATLQRLGFEPDDYTSFEFDLLRSLGFDRAQVREATEHICGHQRIEGAPHLREDHLPVFDTANKNGKDGQRFIHHTGHIKMMAVTQPFISGSISKTINMPNEATIEDIEESYRLSWELGVKCMALYRDGSKASQPLSSSSDDGVSDEHDGKVEEALEAQKQIAWGRIPVGMSPTQAYAQGMHPPRFLLPSRRGGWTQEARVGGHKVYLRTGEYEDGTLGELFIDLAKEGATLRGMISCFAIAVSKGLQYGVPLDEFVDTFTFQTFEPRGIVEGHPNIKMANSIVDYVFRSLGLEYLHRDELAQVPPERDGSLPEPAKGVAVEAGLQVELFDAAAERDVEVVEAAGKFVDEPVARRQEPGTAKVLSPRKAAVVAEAADAGTRALQSALGEMMGDAPLCDVCGHITVRNGACYKCLNCGNSLGCS
jgi:ribonucleoside-diphosphate reductase alpha chain